MICNATSHRWRSFKPLVASEESRQAQAFALYAEVVDATYKEHPRLQSLALPGQRLRPSGQAAQTSAKGPVKPFDENGNRLSVSRCSKIYKRMRILMAPLLVIVIMTISGCQEVGTKPIVTGGNPPEITFRGSGYVVQIVVAGPYSRDYLKRSLKIINDHKNAVTPEEKKELEEISRKYKDENFSIWYLKPNKDSIRVSGITLKYGTVPKELRQVNPEDGSPPRPLKEGSYYCVTAPTDGANFHDTYFIIKNNKAIMVSEEELMREDQ